MSDMSDLRFLSLRVLMVLMMSSSVSDGHGGRTSVGSISLAPRATILVMRFCDTALGLKVGSGGAVSGDGPLVESPWRDFGRKMVDARRRRLGGLAKLADPSIGAV